MTGTGPILSVAFFRTATGNEPVREWLKSLPREERRIIGEALKTVQFGWPLGMPLGVRSEVAVSLGEKVSAGTGGMQR